jgi:hypothetical protein
MSDRLKAGRNDRRRAQFDPESSLPSSRDEIAAHMLGMIATGMLIIGLTYVAIGLWRALS